MRKTLICFIFLTVLLPVKTFAFAIESPLLESVRTDQQSIGASGQEINEKFEK